MSEIDDIARELKDLSSIEWLTRYFSEVNETSINNMVNELATHIYKRELRARGDQWDKVELRGAKGDPIQKEINQRWIDERNILTKKLKSLEVGDEN